MKRSIRRRITLIFIGMMAGVLLAIWALNTWWLEPYYTEQKLKVMEDAYEKINSVVMERVESGKNIGDVITEEQQREWEMWSKMTQSSQKSQEETQSSEGQTEKAPRNPENVLDEETKKELENSLLWSIRTYGDKNNITIILIDSGTGRALVNSGRENGFLVQKLQRYILDRADNQTETLIKHENYVIEKNSDRRSGATYLESWGFLSDDNTMFLMQMPLASIRESVVLSNQFTTGVGLVALICGSVLMYLATRRVTTPIMKLAALSERMSNLDFNASYEDDAEDEIGVLGRSMNTLSDKLKETIGELQEANSRLQRDIEEKIQIDEMRKEFIANVSHELKTPIALIQGYAEGLTEGMAEDEESRNYYCEVIMDEANKMNKMVKQLLTLTALEFGNDTPVLTEFDITELIGDLLSSAQILIQQKEAHVEFCREQPLYVRADEFKIEEVLTNYLNNAMNHLDGDRIIRIRTGLRDGRAAVWVFNTGSHIPEQDIPNLWTKFFKVDKARTRAYGGSGIGLSIVKAIMDAHHQECGVANVEDGVEFWFTLEAV